MEIVNSYIKYLNILLIVIVVVLVIRLLLTLSKMSKGVKLVADDGNRIGENINHMNSSLDRIRKSEDSWMFFASIYAIFVVLRETLKYRKSEKSLSRSFAKSVTRHAGQISRIKL